MAHPPYGAAGPCLPGSTHGLEGACVTLQVHHLPFQPGYSTQVTQGYHGAYSHVEAQAYAIDFECEEGDKIVASRGGGGVGCAGGLKGGVSGGEMPGV